MVVSIVRVVDPLESLRQAIALCDGFAALDRHAKVVLKPNLSVGFNLPPYGMTTTTSILEGLLQLLIEQGCSDITIAEGSIEVLGFGTRKAYARSQIDKLARKYGVRLIDLDQGPFREVDLGGVHVQIAETALQADFLINVPVLKTHGLTKVSLGFKNLKGCLSPRSKTKFHATNRLNLLICLLNDVVKSHLTVIDGTYVLENGPDTLLGTAHRKDVYIASRDGFACDVVGSWILGIDVAEVGYLCEYAEAHGRTLNMEDIHTAGESNLIGLRERLEWRPDVVKELLTPAGITGVSIPHPGDTLCCRCYTNLGLALVALAEDNGNRDCGDAVIHCGKALTPDEHGGKTLVYGTCATKIRRLGTRQSTFVKGCPPRLRDTLPAFFVQLLGWRRALTVMPPALLRLAGAKMGVYNYSLPKWKAYESELFSKRHFQVSPKARGSRPRGKPGSD
jgi:uncharacterized protein (DUF362 family)